MYTPASLARARAARATARAPPARASDAAAPRAAWPHLLPASHADLYLSAQKHVARKNTAERDVTRCEMMTRKESAENADHAKRQPQA